MRLVFLGTASGTPTRERNVSGLALRFDDGRIWIFDCGEGTQHRLLHTSLRPGRIERIFLTHLHGDHCYGLPGLLAAIAVHDRGKAPVQVIGPRGVGEWIATTRRVSDLGLSYPLEVVELDGPAVLAPMRAVGVEVHPLIHRVPSYGFVLREAARPGRLRPERCHALGVPDGPLMGRLAAGETVHLADGTRADPEAVCGPPRPGRVLAILGDGGDASDVAAAIAATGDGCDCAVHECTYDASRAHQARRWGHSTTRQAANFARICQARILVLNHLSSRYTTDKGVLTVDDLVKEVAAACLQTRVLAADDLCEVTIPPREGEV